MFHGCALKNMFWKNVQNSQENACDGVYFDKVEDLRLGTLLKKKSTQVLSVNFAKFSETTFFQSTFGWGMERNQLWFSKLLDLVISTRKRKVDLKLMKIPYHFRKDFYIDLNESRSCFSLVSLQVFNTLGCLQILSMNRF